eukprot:jgi/Chlat1/3854/Chrsp26S04012
MEAAAGDGEAAAVAGASAASVLVPEVVVPLVAAGEEAAWAGAGGGEGEGVGASNGAEHVTTEVLKQGVDDAGNGHTSVVTAEERIKRGVAPIKQEYLLKVGERRVVASGAAVTAEKVDLNNSGPPLISNNMSKRARKRAREEARKSTQTLCYRVARRGNASDCHRGEACNQNHDVEAFLAQKPADLPGACPYTLEGTDSAGCPYGVSCRFASSHQPADASTSTLSEDDFAHNALHEVNYLDHKLHVQLRRDARPFTKADAVLKGLGVQLKYRGKAQNTSGASTPGDGGLLEDAVAIRDNKRERKLVDFRNKLYLAPLTTVGNLPFRRICKNLGVDITCGEMAMATNLLQGMQSEWALLRRHQSEDMFGVQVCGGYPDTLARVSELLNDECQVDFVDINMGCPIDIVCQSRNAGSSLLLKPSRIETIVKATSAVLDVPLTVKLRTGYYDKQNVAHTIIPNLQGWGAAAVTLHGRTRQQRYSKLADWQYIDQCVKSAASDFPVIGNGDVFSFTDYEAHMAQSPLATCMVARGALVKPWLFTEIKERRHWDISATERLDILKDFVKFGLQHWGSDDKGVETTRRFLLEWLSFMHRYIPVGLLEVQPQQMTWRPPAYRGRNELETLMASDSAADWLRISEMLIGPPPSNYVFAPKHKSNAYDSQEQNG